MVKRSEWMDRLEQWKSSTDPELQHEALNHLDRLDDQIQILRQLVIEGEPSRLNHIAYFSKAASESLKYAILPEEEWHDEN